MQKLLLGQGEVKVILALKKKVSFKRQFARVLYEDLNRMTKIKDVQANIATVKADIEKEKRKLSSLKSQLNDKKNQIAKNNSNIMHLFKS